MLKYTNVEVTTSGITSNYYYVSCIYQGFRYHIIVDRETKQPKQARYGENLFIVYKNTLAKRGEPGYLECRQLKSGSKFTTALSDYLLAYALNMKLYEAADKAAIEHDEAQKKQWEKEQDDRNRVYVLLALPLIPEDGNDVCGVLRDEKDATAWVDVDKKHRTYEVHILGKVVSHIQ